MKHFEVGQKVWLDKKAYLILAYGASDRVSLLPLEETGPIRVETPLYLVNAPRQKLA